MGLLTKKTKTEAPDLTAIQEAIEQATAEARAEIDRLRQRRSELDVERQQARTRASGAEDVRAMLARQTERILAGERIADDSFEDGASIRRRAELHDAAITSAITSIDNTITSLTRQASHAAAAAIDLKPTTRRMLHAIREIEAATREQEAMQDFIGSLGLDPEAFGSRRSRVPLIQTEGVHTSDPRATWGDWWESEARRVGNLD